MLASPKSGTASQPRSVTCVECGAVADEHAAGWLAYRSDLPPEAEADDPASADVPAVVVFCRACAAGEFGDGSSGW
jgi:hypothetical protein